MSSLIRTVPQRLAILAAVVASIWFCVYPSPAFYYWSGPEASWKRESPPVLEIYRRWSAAELAQAQSQHSEQLARRFVLNYGLYGGFRPDFEKLGLELAFTWLIGIGFAWAVKPSPKSSTGG